MNIFYLDSNPAVAATYHCDKHVIKMILESAQLLCTAVNVAAGEQVTPYKSTHINHPCAIWVRESLDNWNYVYCLMFHLQAEWRFRYQHEKSHKSIEALINNNIIHAAYKYLPAKPFTTPPLCMPIEFQIPGDAVASYRKYYKEGKRELLSYKRREVPAWLAQ